MWHDLEGNDPIPSGLAFERAEVERTERLRTTCVRSGDSLRSANSNDASQTILLGYATPRQEREDDSHTSPILTLYPDWKIALLHTSKKFGYRLKPSFRVVLHRRSNAT